VAVPEGTQIVAMDAHAERYARRRPPGLPVRVPW
jgi:hypothetical protein